MIIAHIIGGLGNQMFQYAAAKALSVEKNTELLLDVTSFDSYALHQGFELNKIFSADFKTASSSDIKKILGWQAPTIVRSVLHRPRLTWLRKTTLSIEPSFQYWRGFQDLSDNTYLSGYWQSERYFKIIESIIRKDFSFKLPMDNENSRTANLISNTEAVSLHIRRGDYVNNSAYSACSLDYYQAAISHFTHMNKPPTFFIFSDDINWVKEHLKIEHPHCYVDHNNGAASYNDMRLMSLCKHNIIANSSFSWWGAWLNANNDKIVITPKSWFNTNNHIDDLIPPTWISL
ncbi:alpha-1,2-fucosyltransferase [Pseudomonas marginalis]|uniref:alpha-1,2-fucosyltransferase n=1 Tax=Pseudomonas marginalis TaxID=298 RepID=UPI003BA03F22